MIYHLEESQKARSRPSPYVGSRLLGLDREREERCNSCTETTPTCRQCLLPRPRLEDGFTGQELHKALPSISLSDTQETNQRNLKSSGFEI